jgi:hypothetical protein
MKKLILPVAILGVIALSGCERTVVTPPNAAVVTPPAAVVNNNPVPVPGPQGPSGAPGPQGATGSPGKSGDTVVIAPAAPSTDSSSSSKN